MVGSRITDTFAKLRSENRMAFMPFVTAGDPNPAATQQVLRTLGQAGVDLIEIGFPYSDPIADGPVIQSSYTRALNAGVTVKQIFEAVGALREEGLPPLVAMVSYAIVYRTGPEAFLDACRNAGFSGLIVPDLPGAEAQELFTLTQERELDLVQLVAPTTPRSRVQQIVSACSGFLYCIAVSGTTGEREDVSTALLEQLKWLKSETELPLAVGFGISQPKHLEPLRGLADGAIVGSAIVRPFEEIAQDGSNCEEVFSTIGSFANEMAVAAHGQ